MSIVAPVREQGRSASATAGSDKFSDARFSGSSSDSDSDYGYSDTYAESGYSGSECDDSGDSDNSVLSK